MEPRAEQTDANETPIGESEGRKQAAVATWLDAAETVSAVNDWGVGKLWTC
jgi:hypothetical protein